VTIVFASDANLYKVSLTVVLAYMIVRFIPRLIGAQIMKVVWDD